MEEYLPYSSQAFQSLLNSKDRPRRDLNVVPAEVQHTVDAEKSELLSAVRDLEHNREAAAAEKRAFHDTECHLDEDIGDEIPEVCVFKVLPTAFSF